VKGHFLASEAKGAICVFVDGLHVGMIGAYGNSWIRTPAIDRLATQSFVFDQAFTECPELEAIGRTLYEGIDPWDKATQRSLEELHAQKVRRLLLSDDPTVIERWGGRFDESIYVERETPRSLADDIADSHLARFFAEATAVSAQLEPPFLLCLHSRGLMTAWDAPYELRDQYTDEEDPSPPDFVAVPDQELPAGFDPDELLGMVHAYAGQVSLLDACLGLWLQAWDAQPAAAGTVLSLMGLRGFALGEHGRIGPDEKQLAGEIVQIPWMIRFPGGREALARSSALVTQNDWSSVISAWFASTPDTSTTPLLAEDFKPVRQAVYLKSSTERGIRTPAWHLRMSASDDQRMLLYAKCSDRWEVNEVSDRCAEIAESLRQLLLAKEGGHESTGPLDDALMIQVD
jgi:hypothetical protein